MSIIGDIVGSISKAVLPSVIGSAFTDTGSLAHEWATQRAPPCHRRSSWRQMTGTSTHDHKR